MLRDAVPPPGPAEEDVADVAGAQLPARPDLQVQVEVRSAEHFEDQRALALLEAQRHVTLQAADTENVSRTSFLRCEPVSLAVIPEQQAFLLTKVKKISICVG